MIELQHINKTFNRNTANESKALLDISLVVPSGQYLVIIGSNGSGKSTLLNTIAGNIPVDSGKIIIGDEDMTRLSDFHRSKYIARIFQNPLLGTAPELTILENFRLAALRKNSKKLIIGTNEKFRKAVRDKVSLLGLGLENKLDQLVGTLSGGQRQALTLLMAVMPANVQNEEGEHETSILLMDEPAAALDPKTSVVLMSLAEKIIRDFRLTALLITHQLKETLAYGNRLILMQEGRIQKDLNRDEKANLQLNDLHAWFE